MEEGKGLSFKWFNFLYGWFVFRIIMESLGVLSSFAQINSYESIYGSLYGVNELVYWIIFCTIVSAILKLIAVLTKHKEGGYAAVNIVLIWDLIYWFVWGLQYELFGAVFAPLLASAFIIPTFFYLKKRKFAYGISTDNSLQKTEAPSPKKCDICSQEDCHLFYSKIIDNLGTRYKNLCTDCVTKHHAEIIKREIKSGEIKFCRKCGNQLLNDSQFCSKCGTAIVINKER